MNPCFVVGLADEGRAQLESCLGFLRAAYPDAPVKVISDGVADWAYPRVCARHGADYIEGRYLKRIECGGEWWGRTLRAGIESGREWIVKIDPDTRVWRPVRTAPAHPIAGRMDHCGKARENILGGFQAIRRDAAIRILDSGILADEELKDHLTFSEVNDEYRHWVASAFMGSDMSLAWIARNLGIPCGDWSEAGINWREPAPVNHDLIYAATHPHRLEPDPPFPKAELTVITTCKGRLHNLKESLPRFLEPGVNVVVVDYGCPQGAADWVLANHPEVTVVRVTGPGTSRFHLSRARNIGAAAVESHGWRCFWDADLVAAPGWAQAIRDSLRPRRYLMSNPVAWDQFGSCVVNSWDFRKVGGYDEFYRGWGPEDGDFYDMLRTAGVRHGWFPGRHFETIPNTDDERCAHYDDRARGRTLSYYVAYHRRKKRWMIDVGRIPDADERRSLFREAVASMNAELGTDFYPTVDSEPVTVEIIRPGKAAMTPKIVATVPGLAKVAEATAGRPDANPGIPPDAPAPTGSTPSPKMTFALHARDSRMEWSIDIGHFIEHGLGNEAASPLVPVVPAAHAGGG